MAVFRGRIVGPGDVTLDFESSEHTWVSRSQVTDWVPRIAFPSVAQAVADWARMADVGDGGSSPPSGPSRPARSA
jgi:hypothetical protein